MAWVNTRDLPDRERSKLVTLTPIEIEPAHAAETPPTEVTFLDDNTVVAAAPVVSSPGHTGRRDGRQRISSTSTTSTGTSTGTSETRSDKPPDRSKLMTMRHPKLDKGPSAAFWDRFAANTRPLQPKDIKSEQIAAEIEAAEENLKNPKWVANASPEQVAGERMKLAGKRHEQSTAELRPDGAGTKSEHQTFRAKFNPDGTIASLDDKSNLQRQGLGLSFDVTDAMMRSQGIDPYASYKLKVLDDTRDERVAIGKRHRTQQLAQSRQHVQKHLERLWATTTDLAARKQGLFELWDDCAESGSEEIVRGGASARSHVIGFIRSQLPAGSETAYTAAELARFNKQRKSRATFTPYEPSL